MKKTFTIIFALLCFNTIISQTTITGSIFDIYIEPMPSATISSDNNSTTSSYDGSFSLTVNKKLPFSIIVSMPGHESRTIEVTDESELSIVMEQVINLQEVIISASRTPERVIESPVSVERLGLKGIKNTTSANFYEGLTTLKGIDVLSNSFSVKNIVSNRGFANTENVRFVQLVDGIETTLPFLNYSLGNNFGTTELDISSVEILPGAASALYGPNAVNGIMLMNTKNPFDTQGISTYIKGGYSQQESGTAYGFYDVGVRYAHAFSDKLSAKVNFAYTEGEDWHATDYRNTTGEGGTIIDGLSHTDDAAYDGLNVYGDEIKYNLVDVYQIFNDNPEGYNSEDLFGPGRNAGRQFLNNLSNIDFSRVGYNESDLVDYKTKSMLIGGSLHFRPFGNKDLELIAGVKFNTGDNVIHGINRYFQKGSFTQQYSLECLHKNFFVRTYYTKNSANLIDPRLLGQYITNTFKDELAYTYDFIEAYTDEIALIRTALEQGVTLEDNDYQRAAEVARLYAESDRPEVGSTEFNNLVSSGESISVKDGGALLKDDSSFYHTDFNYNFANLIDFIDIQVGGSSRNYQLNSNGNIYDDEFRQISYGEYGLYTQFLKRFFNDRTKITLTGRYDKSTNFKGNFSPRASITHALGKKKNHNIRFSYQTGFRNPSSRDQYANINVGNSRKIIGTTESNLDEISDTFQVVSTLGANQLGTNEVEITAENILNNSYTYNSVQAFKEIARDSILAGLRTPDVSGNEEMRKLLQKAEFDYVKPETVQTFELGYRGVANIADKIFEFDIAGFYSIYENFITQKSVIVPFYGDIEVGAEATNQELTAAPSAVLSLDTAEYIIRTNAESIVNSYGFNGGFTTKIFGNFDFGANYAYSDFEVLDDEDDFKPAYNTPKHVVKVSLGNDKVFNNFGFRIDGRWQDKYLYQSLFIDDYIDARTVVDAQINYKISSWKSTFKIGGTNIGGNPYVSVPGAGTVGSLYYINWTINN